MFDITSEHIARLNDTDLRILVGRLCEAELRQRGLPASPVTYGGDQRAADGGIDVQVALRPPATLNGFIPRSLTGYQVKATDMPAAKIKKEMKPKGRVLPAICELAKASGAYIIVSSRD